MRTWVQSGLSVADLFWVLFSTQGYMALGIKKAVLMIKMSISQINFDKRTREFSSRLLVHLRNQFAMYIKNATHHFQSSFFHEAKSFWRVLAQIVYGRRRGDVAILRNGFTCCCDRQLQKTQEMRCWQFLYPILLFPRPSHLGFFTSDNFADSGHTKFSDCAGWSS